MLSLTHPPDVLARKLLTERPRSLKYRRRRSHHRDLPGVGFLVQAFCQWKRNPVSQRDWDDAHPTTPPPQQQQQPLGEPAVHYIRSDSVPRRATQPVSTEGGPVRSTSGLRRLAARSRRVGVCSGAFSLGAAGFWRGGRAPLIEPSVLTWRVSTSMCCRARRHLRTRVTAEYPTSECEALDRADVSSTNPTSTKRMDASFIWT